MASSRLVLRSSRALLTASRSARPFSVYAPRCNDFSALNARAQDTAEEYRRFQIEKPLNPHLTSTSSTITNKMPSVGSDSAPPELLSATDSGFTPKDAVPENTERMTGGTQGSEGELGVGELEGAKFKVEPLRRTGEDDGTMRARLLYQSRKRGTLESELLMSTFADANLATMTTAQLQQYDLFLDENDWDIYYWATQEPSPTLPGAESNAAAPDTQGKDEWKREPARGEWAQTVGTFRPAYRPVPARWRESEILGMLRRHVRERSAGGVVEGDAHVGGKGLNQSVKGAGGGGLGMMPEVRHFD